MICLQQPWTASEIVNCVIVITRVLAESTGDFSLCNTCSFGWAAQVFRMFAEHGKSGPLMAGALVEVQPDKLLLALQVHSKQREVLRLCPWTLGQASQAPGPGVKLCKYRCWFSCPAGCRSAQNRTVLVSTVKLQRF